MFLSKAIIDYKLCRIWALVQAGITGAVGRIGVCCVITECLANQPEQNCMCYLTYISDCVR